MARTPWQQRIRRAEYLAGQHSYAAEILAFYVRAAHSQEDLYQQLERAGGGVRSAGGGFPALVAGQAWASHPLLGQPENGTLLRVFPQFLRVVEDHGPERLAQVAHDLRTTPSSAWSELLNAVWAANHGPSEPEEFLAFTFLQPCAEFTRDRAALQLNGYTLPLCPLCDRKPALGILRQMGDGGRRSLLCGFCLTEWEFRRVVCPGCGEEDHAKLPVYTAAELPYIRVECCDSCKTYIKTIDLTKNGLADPLVDELASIPLSLWAQERGYAKLHPNLMGM